MLSVRSRLIAMLALLCLAAALRAGRGNMDVPLGLRATYFGNVAATGAPAISVLDPVISTPQMIGNWRGAAPQAFSARWSGFVAVDRAGAYAFSLTSDDSSSLTIDDQLLIDLSGMHGAETSSAQIDLDRGVHAITITYAQYGGGYALELNWGTEGGDLRPLPGWRLSPRRLRLDAVLLAHRLNLAALVAVLCAVLLVLPDALRWTLRNIQPRRRHVSTPDSLDGLPGPQRWSQRWAALALFIVLAVVHTWPLASNPGGLSRNDNGDTVLNEWIIAWVAHELPRDPRHLFDANIFYPEPNTLAFSESMLVQSLMAAPILWLGGSPVLAYNLMVLAGLALTAWSMFLLVGRWAGSTTAGLVSGAIYGFNAHSLTRIPHLQAQHVEFLPAALYVLDRLLRQPRVKRGATLGLCFVLQSLASIHLFVFTSFALAAGMAVRGELWRGPHRKPLVLALAVAALIGTALMLPFLLPYLQVSHEQNFRRSLEVIAGHTATWRDYVSTPSRLHYPLWSERVFGGTALFPGALALFLAGWTVVAGIAFTNPRARMCVAIAVVGIVLSFGTDVPGYALLWSVLPPLQAIRAVVRFGYLAIVGISVLAGFGVILVRQRIRTEWWPATAVLLVLIASFESLAAPLGLSPFAGVPPIYATIAGEPQAIVVEMPFYDVRGASQHASYMLNSTAHWRPLVNGYSGFQPASFYANAEAFAHFPDARARARLRELGVTHVFVHRDRMAEAQIAGLTPDAGFTLLRSEGSISLYHFSSR